MIYNKALGKSCNSFLSIFLIFSLPFFSYAGELDDFEDSVDPEPKAGNKTGYESTSRGSRKKQNEKSCSSNDLSFGCFVGEVVFDLATNLVVFGGTYSFYRVDSSPHRALIGDNLKGDGIPLRRPGEPLIPFVRLDIDQYRTSSRVKARDYRFETGYGAIALGYNKTRYRESNPHDKLDITRIYGLYRMSFGSHFEADFGIGSLELNGDKTRSFLYTTIPILIHTSETIGFEFRPSWASNIIGNDISVLLKSEYASFKLGYKRLSTDTKSLKGPYVGVAVHY